MRVLAEVPPVARATLFAVVGAILALLVYALFELATERAFGLIQPFFPVPVIGTMRTSRILSGVFSVIFVILSLVAFKKLPREILSHRMLSLQAIMYLLYCVVILSVIFPTVAPVAIRKLQFLDLVLPMLISPTDFLPFILLPLVAVYFEYRKQGISIWSRWELIRLLLVSLVWLGLVLAMAVLKY